MTYCISCGWIKGTSRAIESYSTATPLSCNTVLCFTDENTINIYYCMTGRAIQLLLSNVLHHKCCF